MSRAKARREPNITFVGPYQYKVTIRVKGFSTTCKTFETMEDAKEFRDVTKLAMRRGHYIDTSQLDRITLSELLDRYSTEVLEGMKSCSVRRSKVRVIKRHTIAREVIGNITGMHIAKYRDERLKVVTGSTVRDELTLLSHLFKIARQEWGLPFPGNPVDAVRSPKPNKARDRRLEAGEEVRLLATCREYSAALPDLVLFALETAMRRGEIANLRWENFKGNIAHVVDTKNNEDRDVPLSTTARAILARQPRNIRDNRIFTRRSDSIGKAFSRATSRAKSPDGTKPQPIINLRFHDLRHEAISRLFELGLNPMQVAAISGHKTLQMLKRYTHLKAEDLVKMLG